MWCRCPFTMLRVLSCSFSPQTPDNPNRPLSRLPQPAILFLYSDLEQLTIIFLSDSSVKLKNRLIHYMLYLAAPLQKSTYLANIFSFQEVRYVKDTKTCNQLLSRFDLRKLAGWSGNINSRATPSIAGTTIHARTTRTCPGPSTAHVITSTA